MPLHGFTPEEIREYILQSREKRFSQQWSRAASGTARARCAKTPDTPPTQSVPLTPFRGVHPGSESHAE